MVYRTDVAIVGAGIVGLAQALAAARRGYRVTLFERDRVAQGASIRNFGMIWPIGQPPGPLLQRALLSRSIWQQVAPRAGIALDPCGSLHLAYHADEIGVLEEFAAQANTQGYDCRLLTADETTQLSPAVQTTGLLGALWSASEMCVDPREAIARLPRWLHENHGVELQFNTTVQQVESGRLITSAGDIWETDRISVCSGVDFATLFPEILAKSGIRRCKLQMMSTGPQPDGWRLGPMIAGGLTLCHYAAFQACPTLPQLRQRFDHELPDYLRFGIHVMASQNATGEVIIGDSHEYDDDISPFDKTEIDQLILTYLRRLIRLPESSIVRRWHGLYAKHPTLPLFLAEPISGVHIVNALGGAGMTMSFGTAEELWQNWE